MLSQIINKTGIKMRQSYNINIWYIIGIILITSGCKPQYQTDDTDASETIKTVRIQELAPTRTPLPIVASGRLASKAKSFLSFKTGGIIDLLYVDEGQQVKKGQLLGKLNLTEINANVIQARNAMEKSERDLTRVENLYRDTVATLEQFQNAQTAFEIAKAGFEIAAFNQKHSKIVAPDNGKILKKFVENAEVVSSGKPIFSFGSNGSNNAYLIKIGVADKDVVKLKLSDSALVHFDAYPYQSFNAHVTEIAEAADPVTGVFEIELTLTPDDNILKNGFIGKVTIYPSNQPAYYKISLNALVEGNHSGVNIFVPSGTIGKAKKIVVRPDYIGNNFFTVLISEWKAAKQVITDGSAYLKDGESFTVIN